MGDFEDRLAAAQAKERIARADAAAKATAATEAAQRQHAETTARARALVPEVRKAAGALQRSGRTVRGRGVSYWDGKSRRGGSIRRALTRSTPGWGVGHLFVPISGQPYVNANGTRFSLEEFAERGSVSWTDAGYGSSGSSTSTIHADREFDGALTAIAEYLA